VLKPTQVFSPLAEQLEPEGAFVYLDLAAEARRKGIDVVSFGIGQPDFSPPREVIEATKEALDKGHIRYISTLGLPELRERIASYVSEKYGVDVKPSEVAVTVGAKAALYMTISLLTRPGDEVVVQDPAFPTYECVVRHAGGRPVFVRLREENEFRLSREDVEREIKDLHRVRGIVVNSPHNPTGAVLSESDVEELLELAKRRSLFIISDEIYEDYVYEGRHRSFLQDPEWRDYVVYISGLLQDVGAHWDEAGLRGGEGGDHKGAGRLRDKHVQLPASPPPVRSAESTGARDRVVQELPRGVQEAERHSAGGAQQDTRSENHQERGGLLPLPERQGAPGQSQGAERGRAGEEDPLRGWRGPAARNRLPAEGW